MDVHLRCNTASRSSVYTVDAVCILCGSNLSTVVSLKGKAGRSKAASSSIYRKVSAVSVTAAIVHSSSVSTAMARADAGELPPSSSDRLKYMQTL